MYVVDPRIKTDHASCWLWVSCVPKGLNTCNSASIKFIKHGFVLLVEEIIHKRHISYFFFLLAENYRGSFVRVTNGDLCSSQVGRLTNIQDSQVLSLPAWCLRRPEGKCLEWIQFYKFIITEALRILIFCRWIWTFEFDIIYRHGSVGDGTWSVLTPLRLTFSSTKCND